MKYIYIYLFSNISPQCQWEKYSSNELSNDHSFNIFVYNVQICILYIIYLCIYIYMYTHTSCQWYWNSDIYIYLVPPDENYIPNHQEQVWQLQPHQNVEFQHIHNLICIIHFDFSLPIYIYSSLYLSFIFLYDALAIADGTIAAGWIYAFTALHQIPWCLVNSFGMYLSVLIQSSARDYWNIARGRF